MNPITQTLVRALLKIGAGWLLSKGFLDHSGSEELIASGLGLAGIVWGVFHRSGGTSETVPIKKVPLLALMLSAALAAGWFLPLGCASDPQRIAYNIEAGTEITVDVAMKAWGDYVAQAHPPLAQEVQVKALYERYQAAALLAADAGEAYATLAVSGTTNTPSAEVAKVQSDARQQNAARALADLVSFIRALGVKL